MFKEIFVLFFLIHIIGDFYVQNKRTAGKKKEKLNWVFVHCFLYLLTSIVILSLAVQKEFIKYGMILSVTHALIDLVKYVYIRQSTKNGTIFKERTIFLTDQLLHMVFIIWTTYLAAVETGGMGWVPMAGKFFKVVEIEGGTLISWLAAMLLIGKPANILIVRLISIYRPEDSEKEKEKDNQAGRFIGLVERIIILMLISLKQYAAIGLVLTAKSIARYDRISNEKNFAEYYLLGTLISTAIVIGASFLL